MKRQRRRRHHVVVMLMMGGCCCCCWLLLTMVLNVDSVSASTTLYDKVFHSRSFRQRSRRRRQDRLDGGTQIQWGLPTKERLSQWCLEQDGGRPEEKHNTAMSSWNHDSVGMTNPCLHISLSAPPNHILAPSGHLFERKDNRRRVVVSKDEAASSWWPHVTIQSSSLWRVLRYRCRVGHGIHCYESVRDAALQWDFEDGGKRGIVSSSCSSKRQSDDRYYRERHDDEDARGRLGCVVVHTASYGDGDLYDMPTTSSKDRVCLHGDDPRRRMVTYAEVFSLTNKRARLFVVNPVKIVYIVLDQRGPSTTYTSTAYATMRGHWLQGEERVTVAHRDDSGSVDVEILSYSRPASTLWGRLIWPLIGPMQSKFFQSQMEAFDRVGRAASFVSSAATCAGDQHRET